MKRLLYACSALVIVTSFGLAVGRSYAAHSKAKAVSVRLCVLTPVGVPALVNLSHGMENGAQLAVDQWKSKMKKVGVNLGNVVKLDYAKADGSGYDPARAGSQGDNCAGMSNTYAMIGTLNSGAAKVAEPRLNRDGMAMISPANTNIYLTSPKQRRTYEPATASGKVKTVTYFRTVTTDALQGAAAALAAKSKYHYKTFALVDDRTEYGAGLAVFFQKEAKKLGMKQVYRGSIDPTDSATIQQTSNSIGDGIAAKKPNFSFCGCDSETSFPLPLRLRKDGYNGPYWGGDAIYDPTFLGLAKQGGHNIYATSVVLPTTSKQLKSFARQMRNKFHKAIYAYDGPSHDAAAAALQAIYNVAKAHKLKGSMFARRAAVSAAVSHVTVHGVLGTTKFDKNGDTSDRILYLYFAKTSSGFSTIGRISAPKGVQATESG